MARPPKPPIDENALKGFKYFKWVDRELQKIHWVGCGRDRAGNRRLHMDQYCRLVMLFLLNPQIGSLHGVQQCSLLRKVQKRLGVQPTSMGSLSESVRLFGAEHLEGVIDHLLAALPPVSQKQPLCDLDKIITAVDGTLLKNLPCVVDALWTHDKSAYKAHLHFEVCTGRPVGATVTDGRGNEKEELAASLQPGRMYLLDRGYFKYALFQQIVDVGSSFCARAQNYLTFEVVEERELSDVALDNHVVRDAVVRLGHRANNSSLRQPYRIVVVQREDDGSLARGSKRHAETMTLVTDLLDIPPELVVWLYSMRWEIETFFRFFKHTLHCDHLLSHSANGVRLQVYLAIIVCLLLALLTGHKPDTATWRMVCWYLTGLAEQDELEAFLERKKARS